MLVCVTVCERVCTLHIEQRGHLREPSELLNWVDKAS